MQAGSLGGGIGQETLDLLTIVKAGLLLALKRLGHRDGGSCVLDSGGEGVFND